MRPPVTASAPDQFKAQEALASEERALESSQPFLEARSLYAFLSQREDLATLVEDVERQVERRPAPSRSAPAAKELAVVGANDLNFTTLNALASLHQRSRRRQKLLTERPRQHWDVLVVGAGVHDQILHNTLRSEGSAIRVLTVERGSQVAETFSQAGVRVEANSTARAPGANDEMAIPGVGNINNFPLGVLQLPDVDPGDYPKLGTFAKVVTINRGLSINDVLFDHEVTSVKLCTQLPGPDVRGEVSAPLMADKCYEVSLKPSNGIDPPIVVTAQVVVDARGIGDPTYPVPLIEELASFYRKTFYENPTRSTFPAILHSKDYYAMTSSLRDPFPLFADKRIAVVGTGDSAKTVLEYLLRVVICDQGPSASRLCPKTFWIGQQSLTAETYERGARFRYKRLARFIPTTLEPVPQKLTQLSIKTTGSRRVNLTLEGGRALEVDIVILATGLKPRFQIYKTLTTGLTDDAIAALPDSSVQRVNGILREGISPYANLPGKQLKVKDTVHNIFFVGPGGGNFIKGQASRLGMEAERADRLFGITENLVSIFALGPVTEATARLIARSFTCTKRRPSEPVVLPPLELEWSAAGPEVGPIDIPVPSRVAPQLTVLLSSLSTDTLNRFILFRLLQKLQVLRILKPNKIEVLRVVAAGGAIKLRLQLGGSLGGQPTDVLVEALGTDPILLQAMQVSLLPTTGENQGELRVYLQADGLLDFRRCAWLSLPV